MSKAISRYKGISQMKSTLFLCSLSIWYPIRAPQVQFFHSQYFGRHNSCGTSSRPLDNLIRYLRPELNKVWEIFVHGLHPSEQTTTSVPAKEEKPRIQLTSRYNPCIFILSKHLPCTLSILPPSPSIQTFHNHVSLPTFLSISLLTISQPLPS